MCIFLRNLKTKNNPLTCRCNFSSLCSEKNVYHSPASKFFPKKRHSSEFFTKNDNSVNKSVNFTVKKFYQFYVHIDVEMFIHVFMRLCGGEKTGIHAFLHLYDGKKTGMHALLHLHDGEKTGML